jgi:hypothetical protein
MPLHNGTCDICGTEVEILFQVAILDVIPSGGTKMVEKWCCYWCFKMLMMALDKEPELDPKDILPE